MVEKKFGEFVFSLLKIWNYGYNKKKGLGDDLSYDVNLVRN